eukprot:Gb_14249 [translate_table: standard]
MELLLYSFEGIMKLHEWFQRLEEYFKYARFQNEHDKALTTSLHLTSQAYTWAKRQYKYWDPSFPWDTIENLKEELEFEEKWNYKERKALELEYYDDIEEEALELEDDKSKCKDLDEELNEQLKEEENDSQCEETIVNNHHGEVDYTIQANHSERQGVDGEYGIMQEHAS